jgi:hypothetical protein
MVMGIMQSRWLHFIFRMEHTKKRFFLSRGVRWMQIGVVIPVERPWWWNGSIHICPRSAVNVAFGIGIVVFGFLLSQNHNPACALALLRASHGVCFCLGFTGVNFAFHYTATLTRNVKKCNSQTTGPGGHPSIPDADTVVERSNLVQNGLLHALCCTCEQGGKQKMPRLRRRMV